LGKHSAPPNPSKNHRILVKLTGLVTLAFLCLIAVGSAYVGYQMIVAKKSLTQVVTGIFIPDPQKYFANSRVMVLIAGLDYDYSDQDYETSANSRTDTIMVAALDLPTHSVNLLSVPRDMDFVFPNGHEGKINEGHVIGGIAESQRDIAQFLGIQGFDRYVVVRINALRELIDAVGGIDLNVEKQMDYDDSWGHLHIHLKPGMQHLNGEQAVGYSRFRHDEMGDITRIERQQKVMRTLVAKLKNDKLNDIAHIRDLIGVLQRNVDTNFTRDEEISLASWFSDLDPKTIKTGQVPYLGDKEIAAGDVLIPDDAGKLALVNKLLLGPMGPEPTSDPATVAKIDPKTVHVDVQNGSGVSGLGAKLAAVLRAKGFVVDSVGNAPTFGYTTTEIHVHGPQIEVGERIRQTLPLPSASITPDPQTSPMADATVIVGQDYGASAETQASAVK